MVPVLVRACDHVYPLRFGRLEDGRKAAIWMRRKKWIDKHGRTADAQGETTLSQPEQTDLAIGDLKSGQKLEWIGHRTHHAASVGTSSTLTAPLSTSSSASNAASNRSSGNRWLTRSASGRRPDANSSTAQRHAALDARLAAAHQRQACRRRQTQDRHREQAQRAGADNGDPQPRAKISLEKSRGD